MEVFSHLPIVLDLRVEVDSGLARWLRNLSDGVGAGEAWAGGFTLGVVVLGGHPAAIGVRELLVVGGLVAVLDGDVNPDVSGAPGGRVVPALAAGAGGGGGGGSVVALGGGWGAVVGGAVLVGGARADVVHRRFLDGRPV